MTSSAIFTLTREAEAAFNRHQIAITGADTKQRKQARDAALDHLADLFLAHQFERERIAENQRIQRDYEAAQKAARIAAKVEGWAGAKVGSLDGLARFFCDVVGGAITSCDASGNVGNKAASRISTEAVSDLKNQNSERQFIVALPPGLVALVADTDVMAKLADRWALPFTVQWAIGGRVYSLYHADIKHGFDCGRIAFNTSVRCGLDAVWATKPGDVELDGEGLLPALPAQLQGALRATAPGAEGLLEQFLMAG